MSQLPAQHRATLGQLTRVLLTKGLVRPAEIHAMGLRSRDVSRSHRVAIVELGAPGIVGYRAYVVKQLLPGTDRRQGSPDQERAVYRLAAESEALARLVPRVHHAEPHSDFLVLGYRPELESVTQRAQRNHWSDGLLAAALGEAIGDWHELAACQAARAPVAEVPWVFSAFGDDRPDFLTDNPPVADFVAQLERSQAAPMHDWLAQAADRWRPSTIIHGDLRFDNALVAADGQVVLIDWEFGGRGDPAWDVAAALQELLSSSSAADAASAVPVLSGVGLVLLRAYAGRTQSSGSEDDFADRLLSYTAARLVLRALQLAQQQGLHPHEHSTHEPGHHDPAGRTEQDRHLALALALQATPELLHHSWRAAAV